MKKLILTLVTIAGVSLVGLAIAREDSRLQKLDKRGAVALSNELENIRLELHNVKSWANKLRAQRDAEHRISKDRERKVAHLVKVNKDLNSANSKLGKKVSDRDREIGQLKAALKSKAWKRSNWFIISLGLILAVGAGAFVFGSLFKRTQVQYVDRVVEKVVYRDPPQEAPVSQEEPKLEPGVEKVLQEVEEKKE
jgi:hypothetical protein